MPDLPAGQCSPTGSVQLVIRAAFLTLGVARRPLNPTRPAFANFELIFLKRDRAGAYCPAGMVDASICQRCDQRTTDDSSDYAG